MQYKKSDIIFFFFYVNCFNEFCVCLFLFSSTHLSLVLVSGWRKLLKSVTVLIWRIIFFNDKCRPSFTCWSHCVLQFDCLWPTSCFGTCRSPFCFYQEKKANVALISTNGCSLFLCRLCFPSSPSPLYHHQAPRPHTPHHHPVIVLVLAAAVSPEVKQSGVIYQRIISPIAEPRKPGPGLWRHSPQLIMFQSSAMMNVKKLHPRYRRCELGRAESRGGRRRWRAGRDKGWKGQAEERTSFGNQEVTEVSFFFFFEMFECIDWGWENLNCKSHKWLVELF